MLATFATLILLVQHISTMLQAPNIAAAAGAELQEVVSAEIPQLTSGDHARDGIQTRPTSNFQDTPDTGEDKESYPVRARSTGYIQYIDPEIMFTLAQERNVVIRLLHKPGHYVQSGTVVALIWPPDQVDQQFDKLLCRAFQIGNGRTPTQDIEYAVNQLTEMAVRAMSPAINDPFTAMTCLDHMGVGLAQFIRQGERASQYTDRNGKLRLVLEPVTFGELLNAAFDMLRHASCSNASVLLHMLEVIDVISQEAKAPGARQLLLDHVRLIQAESQGGDLIEQDRQAILQTSHALATKLGGAPQAKRALFPQKDRVAHT
jgi:uncharacterized membrane protein